MSARTTLIETPPGGIMTEQEGAVTGAVEVTTTDGPDGVEVTARYEGGLDVWTVTGSPLPCGTAHEQVITALTTDPGVDEYGNAAVVSLADWSA